MSQPASSRPRPYAIQGDVGAAPEAERRAAGRLECRDGSAPDSPATITDALVLDDQRLRNELCWFAFDC